MGDLSMTDAFNLAGNLGSSGLLVLLVVKICIDALKEKRNRKNGYSKDDLASMKRAIYDTQKKVQDLHVWHSKTDDEGTPLWYHRRSTDRAIERIAESIEIQTRLFQSMSHEIKEIREHQREGT